MSSVEGRVVTCDKCGEAVFQERVRKASGRRKYNTYGWHEQRDKDYCPECWKKLSDELVLKKLKALGKLY